MTVRDTNSRLRERAVERRKGKPTTPRRAAPRPAAKRMPRTAATPGPRQQAVSWVASGRVFSALLLLGSLLALIYAFTNARFTIQQVEVSGADVLDINEVRTLADAQGQSIWYIDSAALVKKLKRSAYIEDASVRVGLPGTLYLQIVERRPELRWSSGGQHFLVDSSGRVLGAADSSAAITNTLVIEDQTARALQPNDAVDQDALGLARALALRLPAETGMQPISMNWSDERGLFVLAPDNKTVIFGKSERLGEKLTVLDTMLKQGTPFTFLDLRPKTPYFRNEG